MNLEILYKQGFLNPIPTNFKNATKIFWNCFYEALNGNIRGLNGKTRILSIIANDFSYEDIKNNLNVSFIILIYYSNQLSILKYICL